MSTLAFPTSLGIRAVRFGLASNTQLFESPLNRSVQRLEIPGARWQALYELETAKTADVGAFQAFLVKLRGASGTFYGYDPARTTPLGVGTGTPLVNGGSQTGSSLITDGWTPSTAGILQPGDYFSVNDELKMITQSIASDSGGNATLVFEPVLRSSPADNAAITVNTPTCIMRLIDDEQAAWDVNEASFYSMSFSAIETFII